MFLRAHEFSESQGAVRWTGELIIETLATAFTENRIGVVALGCAVRADLRGDRSAVTLDQFAGDDAGGDDDEAVSDDNQNRSEGFAQNGDGGDVPEPDSGHGNDRPVHALRNGAELLRVTGIFDQVHRSTHDDNDDKHRGKKHRNFSAGGDDGAAQRLSFR